MSALSFGISIIRHPPPTQVAINSCRDVSGDCCSPPPRAAPKVTRR